MKIVNQGYKIMSDLSNPLKDIELAARTCYKSENKIGCTLDNPGEFCGMPDKSYECDNTNCKKHSSQKMVKSLIKNKHDAMIEFFNIFVKFYTNRGVTHEMVRHRLFSFAQESTRYVKYNNKEMEFIKPVWCSDRILGSVRSDIKGLTKAERIFVSSCWASELDYLDLLSCDWKQEQAREVLPNSLKTEINVKGNIREWRHFFNLRTSKKAHPQIRMLTRSLLEDLRNQVPVLFDDVGTL